MPLSDPITPGRIDWTGENPGILLKGPDGGFSAMSLFFRVSWSPVGAGQLLLLYGDLNDAGGGISAPNLLMGDNDRLAGFLMQEFIGRLAAFRDAPPFAQLGFRPARSIRSSGDPMGGRYTETVSGDGLAVELVWEDLEPPKALELVPEQTGTKRHVMFTVLVPAKRAKIMVNGRRLPGEVGTRVQAGMETTTAFLYFSETWIIPDAGQ